MGRLSKHLVSKCIISNQIVLPFSWCRRLGMMGLGWVFCPGSEDWNRGASRQGHLLFWRFWGMIHLQAYSSWWQNSVPCGCGTGVSISLLVVSWRPRLAFPASWVSAHMAHYVRTEIAQKFPSFLHLTSLRVPFLLPSSMLSDKEKKSLLFMVDVISWAHLHNSGPILKSVVLISSEFLLPWIMTYGVGRWSWHFWGGGITLPPHHADGYF